MAAVDVDSMLKLLRAQLGSGDGVTWPAADFGGPVRDAKTWKGAASDAAHTASDGLNSQRSELSDADTAVGDLVGQANQIAPPARKALDATIAAWHADKAALKPLESTPAGKTALLHAGAARVGQARAIVSAAHGNYALLAGRLTKITGQLPRSSGHGAIQAVGFGPGGAPEVPPLPPPTDPNDPDFLKRLGLPDYNPGSLPDGDARRVYGIGKLRIIELDEQLAKEGVPLEERARLASGSRTALRAWIREIQQNQVGAKGLDKSDPHMTWDQVQQKYRDQGFTGDDLWRKIIDRSVGSRAEVDQMLGVDPKNPGPLPPILPSNPITSPMINAPPNLPPIGPHGPPTSPLPPTVFNDPATTALPPMPPGHAPLPDWLKDPSPPGFRIAPAEPPSFAQWDHPDPPPHPPAPPPPAAQHPGQSLNLHGPALTQQQKDAAVAAGGVTAIAGGIASFGWLLKHMFEPFSWLRPG